MADPRIRQTVELVLSKVATGIPMAVVDRQTDPKTVADAVIAEAEKRGLKINVTLIDDGVSVEPATLS